MHDVHVYKQQCCIVVLFCRGSSSRLGVLLCALGHYIIYNVVNNSAMNTRANTGEKEEQSKPAVAFVAIAVVAVAIGGVVLKGVAENIY